MAEALNVEAAMALAAAAMIFCTRAAKAQVTVLDPWVRGTVEGQTTTGAYMTLKSSAAARLVAVTSPVAARCSVHEMTMSGNLMRMRALESVPIAAGGTVTLEEGHQHVMLEGLSHTLKPGDAVRLTLTFADSRGKRQVLNVQAPVRPLGAPAPAASGGGAPRGTTPTTQ